MKCYINYLDASNNFKKTRKDFDSYDDAIAFLTSTFEKWDSDMINFVWYEWDQKEDGDHPSKIMEGGAHIEKATKASIGITHKVWEIESWDGWVERKNQKTKSD